MTEEAADARRATTEEAIRAYLGGCREWIADRHDRCGAPPDYVLWGRLVKPEALGPRCDAHARLHMSNVAPAPSTHSTIVDVAELARHIDEVHQKAAGWKR